MYDFVTKQVKTCSSFSFRYDSTHGTLQRDSTVHVSTDGGKLCVNEHKIAVFSERDPKNIPWGSAGIFNVFFSKRQTVAINKVHYISSAHDQKFVGSMPARPMLDGRGVKAMPGSIPTPRSGSL
jgi:glyceraldehyde-3-phosphate dehydrogenase/erythrose-4-phosphate dehydrogenase